MPQAMTAPDDTAKHPAQPLFSDAAVPVPSRLPSYIKDHRKRLRARFLQGGEKALADYEILELVLFRAIPRQDVKPLAYRLLQAFDNNLSEVLAAPPARLKAIEGVGESVIGELKLIEAAAQRLAQSRVMNRHVLSSWDAVVEYCHTTMARREAEHFRVLYLDARNRLIADEEQGRGTVNHVPAYPREIAKRALEFNASALILVHNHPSGDQTPSQADITMTETIRQAIQVFGMDLHDHLIIGREGAFSFRNAGYL